MVHHLRNFGFAKSAHELVIQEEIAELIQDLYLTKETPTILGVKDE